MYVLLDSHSYQMPCCFDIAITPYTRPDEMRTWSCSKYLTLAYSTRLNYLAGKNQINIATSYRMSYPFCRCLLLRPGPSLKMGSVVVVVVVVFFFSRCRQSALLRRWLVRGLCANHGYMMCRQNTVFLQRTQFQIRSAKEWNVCFWALSPV